MRIGIAGFGRMGSAMGERMVAQGHTLAVWNRSPGPGAEAAARFDARVVATPAALAGECDVVLTSLFDETALRAVYFGPGGLTQAALGGRLVIDTSTMAPGIAAELAAAISAAGGRFVDSPVVGTIGPAREGRLIALVGGTEADVADARAVLQLVSRAVHALGPSGAGYAGKLAVNLMKATYWAALGDCLGLARRFSIEPAAILDVIESGPGAMVELPAKMPVLRGKVTTSTFDIAGVLKDLTLMVDAGGGAAEVPVAAGALQAVRRAVEGGWGGRDVAAVALFAADRIASADAVDRSAAAAASHPISPPPFPR